MAAYLDKLDDSEALRNTAWCLANLMKGDSPAEFQIIAPVVPSLVRAMIRTGSNEVLKDVAWGLSYFTQDANNLSL